MEEKKTVKEKLFYVFLVLVGTLILSLLILFFLVIFNQRVEYWAETAFGEENKQEIINFISWSMVGILALWGGFAVNKWAEMQIRIARLVRIADEQARVADEQSRVADEQEDIGMEKMKVIWEKVIANWEKVVARILVFIGVLGLVFLVFWAMDFAVMVNDWVKCKTTDFLCLRDRWEVIKDIGQVVIAGISVLFGVIMAGRWVARVEKNSVKKIKPFWEEYVIPSSQIVRKVLVVGFLFLVGALGLLLFALLFAVALDACIECWANMVLGISDNITKLDVIKFIGSGIAGILVFFGAIAVNSRANAQIQTAAAQIENNKLIERRHIHKRFKAAIEHLGSEQVSVRIASFYDFYHLARDNRDLRKNIFNILCVHLRQITADKEYKEKVRAISGKENYEVKPTEEVQNLLDILFQSKDSQGELIFVEFGSKLREIFLVGARLREANLQKANMEEADLRSLDLSKADLRGASLGHANLERARLHETNLQDAILQRTTLSHADLREANLQGTDLREASLQGADLREANLQDAILSSAVLMMANLRSAKLQGAMLRNANLQDAGLGLANLQKADLRNANLKDAYLRYADLQSAGLQGVDLRDADLRDADLRRAGLQGANLRGVLLHGADLRNADLREANLRSVNFRGVDLRGANLQWVKNLETAKLHKAKLQGVKLRGVTLQKVDLHKADLRGADLRKVDLQGADLRKADLREVKNLETANLSGAKVKDAKFPDGYKLPADADTTSDD